MRRLLVVVVGWIISALPVLAEGTSWEPFLAFPPSASGRIDAVAIYHGSTLYMLGGQPYRCVGTCTNPESGAADYLPTGETAWLQGAPFDDKLEALGGGVDSLGRLVAFGGRNGPATIANDRTFIYDVLLADQTDPSLNRKNYSHTNFAWARDDLGRLYAIGGGPGIAANSGTPNTTDVERYNASSDTWEILAPLPAARASSAAVYDGQGHILVFGGYDALASERTSTVFSYDIGSDTWSTLTNLPLPGAGDNQFSDQRAAMGANGIIYIVGGINGRVGLGVTRSQVYTYEPVTGAWGQAPDLGSPRHAHAVVVDDDGWLYALGGKNESENLSDNERLDTNPVGGECLTAEDCSDGLACNGTESCVDGQCLAGTDVVCGLGEFCATGGICRVQRFDIVDLTTSLVGHSGGANAINNASQVVGDYFDTQDSQWHGFEYDDGGVRDLGTGRPYAISEDGWIAGEDTRAFAIDPGTGEKLDLGTLGGTSSNAQGVGDGGWVVGQSSDANGDLRAFLVAGPGAVMQDLGTLGDYSIAHGVSPTGQVVGESLVTWFDPHAEPFTFDGATPGAVITEMGGVYSAGSARAINQLEHITGWVSNNVDNWGAAFVYDGIDLVELPDVTGKAYSIGKAINNLDQVVGHAFGEWVYYNCCGYIWSNGINVAYFYDGETAINLNDELPENSGWNLTYANGINDAGEIVGTGTFEGSSHAYLLVPHTTSLPDADSDGVPDDADNCPATANPNQENSDTDGHGNVCDNCTLVDNDDQRDSNGDGYGNICDGDFDNNGIVEMRDRLYFIRAIGTSNPHADLNGDGTVSQPDLQIFRGLIGKPPGPSGLSP